MSSLQPLFRHVGFPAWNDCGKAKATFFGDGQRIEQSRTLKEQGRRCGGPQEFRVLHGDDVCAFSGPRRNRVATGPDEFEQDSFASAASASDDTELALSMRNVTR